LAPVALLLEGYHRDPPAKHACLEFFAGRGIDFPDTPAMAFHRGRIDLLQAHLQRDRGLLSQRLAYRDIYPLALGCHEDESLGLHGAPLDGTTLLHMAADFDETEIAGWLIESGADANACALVDDKGFGGHTPLFNIVVSQAYLCGRQRDGAFVRMLLEQGADPNARASLRKGIRFIADETVHEYKDATPIGFGRAFREKRWVSKEAMQEIAGRGGV
jgi:ankyrin repeat protein